MTREIRITKTFRIVMTWTVMQQAMQKRKAPEVGGGTDLAQRRGVGGGHRSVSEPGAATLLLLNPLTYPQH